MKKPFLTGKAKGWLTADGKSLVPHGHPKAAVLFVVPGRKMELGHVDKFSNAAEFFDIPKPEEPKAPEVKKKNS